MVSAVDAHAPPPACCGKPDLLRRPQEDDLSTGVPPGSSSTLHTLDTERSQDADEIDLMWPASALEQERSRSVSRNWEEESDVTGRGGGGGVAGWWGVERLGSMGEEELLCLAERRWSERQREVDRRRRAAELAQALQETRAQLRFSPSQLGHMPANRYGSDAKLPPFDPSRHVPTLALINPHSGAMAGSDILSIARRCPYYQDRFFNIIDVVKDRRRGGLLDVFRVELCRARDEARARGLRPRVISGGGDGTASFALFLIFAALRADDARASEGLADTGNGFIWTDEELAEGFPALAQMPLGTGNDLGNALGWGRKYPGDAELGRLPSWRAREKAVSSLQAWIEAVISPNTPVANFDVFGIMPKDGEEECNFKVCELAGQRGRDPKVLVDGTPQLLMKEAGLPVPLFCCLYFSAGMAPYVVSRFQINRRSSPLHNKLEYCRQAASILLEAVPPQLCHGLTGVEVSTGGRQYFPPRAESGNSAEKYREVGFLNINHFAGGMVNAADRAPFCGRLLNVREPAKFNDGMMDMYRMKLVTPLKSASSLSAPLKTPSLQIQSDKREGGMSLTFHGGRGKGIFFQWDGEARFAFSPSGAPLDIHVRQILTLPVVLGPLYDPRVSGDPHNGQPVRFSFSGASPAERAAARRRVLRGVGGELNAELNASREEMLAAGLPCS